jgi:hypothetical protein
MSVFQFDISGVDVADAYITQEFPLGTLYMNNKGQGFEYVRTTVALTPFLAYAIDHSINASDVQDAAIAGELVDNTATYQEMTRFVGVPQIAVPANRFAWVAVAGIMRITVLANCVQKVALYTVADGADSGCFDDNASGTKRAFDLYIKSTVGASKTTAVAYSPSRLRIAE